MLSFLMAMLRRIKYNLSRNGVNTSAVCKRIFFIQRKAEQSDLCSDVANDSNFDRNPLRGCNYGLEGGAFLILGGAFSMLGGAV